jgi:hypothetical protein
MGRPFVKGIVFNLLEECVRRQLGEAAWDALLQESRLEGAYTSLGNYPDTEVMMLVGAAARVMKLRPEEVVRWFGRSALPLFAQRYPGLFSEHVSTRPFLLTLNSLIHPEVRKLYPGADVPDFEFDTTAPDVLFMDYRSKRRLCAFAEGLIEGSAAFYGEIVTMHQSECMHRGDEKCRFQITFQKRPA